MEYLAKELIRKAFEHIPKILRAAEKAQQNKSDCAHLARRVSSIGEMLTRVLQQQQQQQTETEVKLLSGLGDTLMEAHELVVGCENLNIVSQVYNADEYAEKFREVGGRIDSDLLDLVTFTHRISSPNNRAAATSSAATAPPSPAASGSSSLSRPLEPAAATALSNLSLLKDPPRRFKSAEIVMMTKNFDRELRWFPTQDSSGTVYMGCLHGDHQVAVKRMRNKHERRGEEEEEDGGAFKMELEILRDLRRRHEHIVGLVGWCEEDGDQMLVYDYEHCRNDTLESYLRKPCCWKERVTALLGASRGIDHLHRGTPPVIHRNVSSSSILMDASWAPRLSGFDAAVRAGDGAQGRPVGKVVGAPGYVDPEYQLTKRVSLASDVYSFGVVILEALTGKEPCWMMNDQTKTLVGFALQDIENGNLNDVLDRGPASVPTPSEMEALCLLGDTAVFCLMPVRENRPPMSHVVSNINTALGLLLWD